jgi:hypothetical protein
MKYVWCIVGISHFSLFSKREFIFLQILYCFLLVLSGHFHSVLWFVVCNNNCFSLHYKIFFLFFYFRHSLLLLLVLLNAWVYDVSKGISVVIVTLMESYYLSFPLNFEFYTWLMRETKIKLNYNYCRHMTDVWLESLFKLFVLFPQRKCITKKPLHHPRISFHFHLSLISLKI